MKAFGRFFWLLEIHINNKFAEYRINDKWFLTLLFHCYFLYNCEKHHNHPKARIKESKNYIKYLEKWKKLDEKKEQEDKDFWDKQNARFNVKIQLKDEQERSRKLVEEVSRYK